VMIVLDDDHRAFVHRHLLRATAPAAPPAGLGGFIGTDTGCSKVGSFPAWGACSIGCRTDVVEV
jgi:hypothetical protein